ncbi:hypothetical protein [Ciceribacter selenitireducens]
MTITPSAANVWRDYVTDGVPSSGAHKPRKADIRQWGAAVQAELNAGMRSFDDAADLLASTTSEDTIFVGNVLMQANVSGAFEDSTGKAFAPALYITPSMFGAVGYSGAASGAVADSKAAIQAAFDYSGAHKIPCLMEGKNYNCSEQLIYVDDLNVYGYGATLFPTAWPASGGFLSIHPSDPLLCVVSGIAISGLTISGELLPTPGSGDNTNLFDGARGVYRTVFRDCVAKKVRDGTGGGTGGGGFGMEQGAHDVFYINCTAEDCYRAIRVSGHSGSFADAAAESKGLTNNRFVNFTAKRCGHVIIAHAAGDTTSWNTTDLSRFDAVFDGITIEDCGHYPWHEFDFTTYPTVPTQKTGIFAFFGAQGVRIRNVRIKITSGYTASTDWLGRTGYPASGNYIGAGLSGNVGALAWGWCRDCSIENVTIDGTIDTYWMFHRAITAGDRGTTLPTSAASSLFGMRISGLDHVAGSAATAFDCEAGVDNAKFSVRLEGLQVHAAPTTAIVGTNANALTNVMIEFVTRAGIRVKGRAAEFIASNVDLTTSQQDTHLVGGMSLGAGYGSSGVRDGWTNDGKIWRASTADTSTTTKMAFYNPNGLIGQVRTTTSGVDFVTTSDEDAKVFLGEYDWREAFRIIKADPARDFTWKTSGEYAVGWGAQTSYSVSPDLASPGGWLGPDGRPCDEETDGAEYVPWGIDMGRRTPYLWAAVSRLIDEVDDLRAKLGVTYH